MVLKSIVLKGIGRTNTDEREYDKETVPAMEKWVVREVRIYTSRTADAVENYLYKGTMRIFEYNSHVGARVTHPYPADLELEAGSELRLTGTTDGISTTSVIEVIIEVTAV